MEGFPISILWKNEQVHTLMAARQLASFAWRCFTRRFVTMMSGGMSNCWSPGPGLHGPEGEWEQRSMDTGLCLIVCNRTGRESALNFEGSSSAVIVDGRRQVEYAGKQPAILVIEDLQRQQLAEAETT